MSISELMREGEFSLGIAVQSNLNATPDEEDYVWVEAELAQPRPTPTQYDAVRSKQSVGEYVAPKPGTVIWDFSLKWALHGQEVGYAFASDEPGFVGLNQLLLHMGDAAGVDDLATSITGVDANTLTQITNAPGFGCLVAARESSGVVNHGFVKTVAGEGPYTLTLFEDLGAVPGTTVARIPTVTAYSAADSQGPVAIRITGRDPSQDYAYLGCYPTQIRLLIENNRWMVEADMRCYGGEVLGVAGGLKTRTKYIDLDPIVGRAGARWTFGSQTYFTALNDGTADPEGKCDIRNLVITIDLSDHAIEECPTGNEGVGSVLPNLVGVMAEGALPVDSRYRSNNDGTGGGAGTEIIPVDAWNNSTGASLCVYQGKTAGKIFAAAIRNGFMAARGEPTYIDGKRYQPFSLHGGHWDGDGDDTDAGNKVFVAAVA